MGQVLEQVGHGGMERSRALDAVCALGVAATGADLVIVTRSGADGHAVEGWHGAAGQGVADLPEREITLEAALAGAATVDALTLHVRGAPAGMVMLVRRVEPAGPQDRAVLFRLRQVAEAQMAVEGVLEAVAVAAFHRIEAARA